MRIFTEQNTRELMHQQNKTAIQLFNDTFTPIFEVGKWVTEPDSVQLMRQLEKIAIKDKELDIDKNKADAMNAVNKALFEAATELQKIAIEGFKLKADGTLYKKDKERFFDALKPISKKHGIHINFIKGYGSFRVTAQKSFIDCLPDRTGYQKTSNYSDDVYFFDINENKPIDFKLTLVDGSEIERKKNRLKEVEKLISDLESEKSRLKIELGV